MLIELQLVLAVLDADGMIQLVTCPSLSVNTDLTAQERLYLFRLPGLANRQKTRSGGSNVQLSGGFYTIKVYNNKIQLKL